MIIESEGLRIRWHEWKKLMKYAGGWAVVAAFVVLEFLSLFLFDQPCSPEIERNKESYQLYLSHAEGKIDEDTVKFFEEMDEKFSQADSQLQNIYQDYSAGVLADSDYKMQMEELERLMDSREGFNALYEQYVYAREDTKNRYLMDTNAWDAMLSKDEPDILLILTVMILALLCFGIEIPCGMDAVLKMSVNGERKTAGEKILLVNLLSMGLCAAGFGIRLIVFQIKYGFTHGGYPVQSLSCCKQFTGNACLYEVLLKVLGFQMTGCLLWGMAVSAVIVALRKYAVSMLTVSAGLLLPYYGLPKSYMKYFLPGPLGFLSGTGYYRGTVCEYNEYSGQEVYQFIQVPGHVKAVLVMVHIAAVLLLAGFIAGKYTNGWSVRCHAKVLGMLGCMILCAISSIGCAGGTGGYKNGADADCIIGSSGCADGTGRHENGKGVTGNINSSGCADGTGRYENKKAVTDNINSASRTDREADVIYNMDNRYNYESREHLVYVEYMQAAARIMVRNKKTGDTYPLVRDVFRENKEIYPFFYGEGEYVYYMERGFDHSERYLWSMYDYFSVVRVDLDSFESRVIYRGNANRERALASALGLGADTDPGLSSGKMGRQGLELCDLYSRILAFTVTEDRIYLVTSDAVYAVGIRTGSVQKLFSHNGGNVAYDGDKFFFTDHMSRLNKYEIKDGHICVFSETEEIAAGKFLAGKNHIFFTDREQDARLVSYDLASGEKKVLTESEPYCFVSDEENVFVIKKQDSVIYELDIENGTEKKIGDAPGGVLLYAFSDYGAVLVPDRDLGGVKEYLK